MTRTTTGTPATPAAPTRGSAAAARPRRGPHHRRLLGRAAGGQRGRIARAHRALAGAAGLDRQLRPGGAGRLPEGRRGASSPTPRSTSCSRRWPGRSAGTTTPHSRGGSGRMVAPGRGGPGGRRLSQHPVRPAGPAAALVRPGVGPRAVLPRAPLPGRRGPGPHPARSGRRPARGGPASGRPRLRGVRRRRDRVGLRSPGDRVGAGRAGRVTGEPRYLDQAALFVERRGTARSATSSGAARTTRTTCRSGRHGAARARGPGRLPGRGRGRRRRRDGRRRAAATRWRRQWANTVARRTYMTGGRGRTTRTRLRRGLGAAARPGLLGDLRRCRVGDVLLAAAARRGVPRYADLIERTLYNVVAASPSPTGRPSTTRTRCISAAPGVPPAPDERVPARRVVAAGAVVRGLVLPAERRPHAGQPGGVRRDRRRRRACSCTSTRRRDPDHPAGRPAGRAGRRDELPARRAVRVAVRRRRSPPGR